MNCDPDSLMQAAKCYRCIPAGMLGAVQVDLLCRWANAFSCGTPSNTILLSGAGTGAINQHYHPVGVTWVSDDAGWNIEFDGVNWHILDTVLFNQWYSSSALEFPCVWHFEGLLGAAPAPSGQYV